MKANGCVGDPGFPCVSLRDESWEEAEKIITEAWQSGFCTVLMDDGVMLLREQKKALKSLDGDDVVLKTFKALPSLLEFCKENWWFE